MERKGASLVSLFENKVAAAIDTVTADRRTGPHLDDPAKPQKPPLQSFGDSDHPTSMKMPLDILQAAQTPAEAQSFIEAFAQVTVRHIRDTLGRPLVEAAEAEQALNPDWDDTERLVESGIAPNQVDEATRAGRRYLHIDVAAAREGFAARRLFLGLTGYSDKQQRILFPLLKARSTVDRSELSAEVTRLNRWLDEIRGDGFDPSAFITYQRGIGIHGQTQNLSGAIGAVGAGIAFADAIEQIQPQAIVDTVGQLAPQKVRSPSEVYDWTRDDPAKPVKAMLLRNGRAIVFASSKDANIFEPLGREAFIDANDALRRFNLVAKNQRERAQRLHEHAVGEVKTATDPANLHERMGLASRETQTELRTDRFLMMALLNREILSGGTQGRVMNNRDLTRFSHVFNLHHCWGWDGGRERNPEHWTHFMESLAVWCGL
jgi:hypothetical protein